MTLKQEAGRAKGSNGPSGTGSGSGFWRSLGPLARPHCPVIGNMRVIFTGILRT
jgi:hypothetical protein